MESKHNEGLIIFVRLTYVGMSTLAAEELIYLKLNIVLFYHIPSCKLIIPVKRIHSSPLAIFLIDVVTEQHLLDSS